MFNGSSNRTARRLLGAVPTPAPPPGKIRRKSLYGAASDPATRFGCPQLSSGFACCPAFTPATTYSAPIGPKHRCWTHG